MKKATWSSSLKRGLVLLMLELGIFNSVAQEMSLGGCSSFNKEFVVGLKEVFGDVAENECQEIGGTLANVESFNQGLYIFTQLQNNNDFYYGAQFELFVSQLTFQEFELGICV